MLGHESAISFLCRLGPILRTLPVRRLEKATTQRGPLREVETVTLPAAIDLDGLPRTIAHPETNGAQVQRMNTNHCGRSLLYLAGSAEGSYVIVFS